ncbi:ankyrin repeat-containing domain protein [Phaeosphaeriaceae sp. PMI808]|nr:ankyrin repeat-containing domain protein [Phaeosphaeriaceae sp. PMI808]
MDWKLAVENGDLIALAAAVSACDDVHTLVEDGSRLTPLHYAARRGHTEAVRVLVEKGLEPNATDKFGRTPIYLAVLNHHLDTVQLLLQKKADPNICCQCKTASISKAAEHGDKEIFNLLVKAGAAWNTKNQDAETPKKLAVRNGYGAQWEIHEKDQREVLVEAVEDGDLELVQRLISFGVDPADYPSNSSSPLEIACQDGNIDVVQYLLYDAPIDIAPGAPRIESMGGRAMHAAAKKGNASIVDLLLTTGLSPDVLDSDNMTPMHLAAVRGHIAVAEVLLKFKADVNAKGINDVTPLHRAAKQGKTQMVRFLLQKEADPTARDCQRKTPKDVAHRDALGAFE